MNQLTTYFAKGMGKQSLREAIKAGGWKVLIDGNLTETMVRHGPGADLIGVDQFGNKYFQKLDTQVGRHRWVVYAKSDNFNFQDPSTIPPEWHGWLNGITDSNPTNHEFVKPIYAVEAKAIATATPGRHMPKGAWEHAEQRSWQKYESWKPT